MKFALLSLIVCLSLAVVSSDPVNEVKTGPLKYRTGHLTKMSERLGHFKAEPFTDLYKSYAAAFLYPQEKKDGLSMDNNLNYRPDGSRCVNFFRKFRIARYELVDLDELVTLDACLGYLYDATEDHEKDSEANKLVASDLQQLIADEQLKALYTNTKIDDFSDAGKDCVANLLGQVIQAKAQFRAETCNNHFIQVFIQFAECHQSIDNWQEARESDSYLRIISGLLRKRGAECFKHEVGTLNRLMRNDYTNNVFTHSRNKFGSIYNRQAKQRSERLWSEKLTKLLTAVEGIEQTDEVNVRTVHEILRGVKEAHQGISARLLTNMADYATKTLKPTKKRLRKDSSGENGYQTMIDKLCNPFRASNSNNQVDYTTPIVRLVRMTNHADILGITKQDFSKALLSDARETSPLYLAVYSCNVLQFTHGFVIDKVENSKMEYQVDFVPDTSGMVLWPDAGFY